jgi:RNA polymerase sigma-70 factor, ECF subfamily
VEELNRTLEEVVRREKGRVVGGLVRSLGTLDAAEEAFADAVLAALATWPKSGTPANPAAWLTTTARNQARDAARHRRVVETKAPLLVENETMTPGTIEAVSDGELRLMFTCCHPALTLESQVALTLKIIGGLTTDEIARAFLSNEKTIAQRITRAKQTIEDKHVPYEVPGRAELPERLAAVLAVIYLIFTEGHANLRLELQREALRLSHVLCDLLPSEPEAFGLFALIAFSLARVATRTDDNGELLLLSQQDRSRWDRAMIKEGLFALERARRLGGHETYVVQAELAACHTTAASWDDTDWRTILRHYDALFALNASPVVALNRAVAVCMHVGPREALAALAELEAPLARYHLFYAMRADFRRRLGEDARADYARALELAPSESDRAFLRKQM